MPALTTLVIHHTITLVPTGPGNNAALGNDRYAITQNGGRVPLALPQQASAPAIVIGAWWYPKTVFDGLKEYDLIEVVNNAAGDVTLNGQLRGGGGGSAEMKIGIALLVAS